MILKAITCFCSLYVTSTAFSYFAFGKQVIETHGYMGGTATLNKFDDFLILCLSSSLFTVIVFAVIYFICAKAYQYFSKKTFTLKSIQKSAFFALLWLAIATFNAGGCAENWGNTWTTFEIFKFFVLGNPTIAIPLLSTGMLSALLIKEYL